MPLPLIPLVGAVTGIASAIKGAVAPEPAPRLGKDDFLKLLVAQLKNQNPLNPMQNDQFIAQSAQFTQIEELQNIGKTLAGMAGGAPATALAGGTALLGRPVAATAASFTYAGASTALPFTLDLPVGNAAVEVMDAGGTIVARLPLGTLPPGAHSVDLHAGSAGRPLPAGQYRYRVVSVDGGGRSTPLAAITGLVTGVSMEQGTPVLALGARRITLADVASVGVATR